MLVVTARAATARVLAPAASADPLTCNLTGYKAAPGLTAAMADNALDGDVGRRQRPGSAAAVRDRRRHADDSGAGGPTQRRRRGRRWRPT